MGGTARRPILPYVVGAIGLILMVGVSEYGANRLSALFGRRSAGGTEVGRLENGHGAIIRVRGAERSTRRDGDESRQVLIDGDRLETGADAEATLTLNSQDELVVGPKSVVAFELWNERDPNSPVYVHVIAGEVTSKRAGVRGRAYVVRDGHLYLPGQKPGVKQAPLVITRESGPNVSLAPDGSVDAQAKEGPESPAPSRTDDPETLANEYVEEMIASRQTQLQKCWLSRLKDKPKLAGKLTVQFEISRRGKVREASVVDSSLDDAQLQQCVTTVVERIPFRSFTGPEISIAYPITFE